MDSTTNTQPNIHNDWDSIFKEVQVMLDLKALDYTLRKEIFYFDDYPHYSWLKPESLDIASYLGSTLFKNEDKPYDPENEPKLIP